MQRLAIDIGNTSVKMAVFDDEQIILFDQSENPEKEKIENIINRFANIKSSVLSAVRDYPVEIDKLLSRYFFHVTLNHKTPLPFINKYATPDTLGKDRVAAVAAAATIFPGKNVLVIDAGTSITYDVITRNNEYLGGGISPGIMMRFKALNTFTGKLPLITKIAETPLTGNDTESSIMSGVLNGVAAEMEGIINEYRSRFEDLRIIISGGDYNYFDKKLKNSIFAAPNIVMQGLIEILKFNENQ